MSFSKIALTALFIAAVCLAGCGQKGDLYLPAPQSISDLGQ